MMMKPQLLRSVEADLPFFGYLNACKAPVGKAKTGNAGFYMALAVGAFSFLCLVQSTTHFKGACCLFSCFPHLLKTPLNNGQKEGGEKAKNTC
jgi:hypothetical protein